MLLTRCNSGFALWSGRCDDFSVSNRICNHFFCLYFLHLYMLVFLSVMIARLQCISMFPALSSCKVLVFRGGTRIFPTGGLTLPMRGLKYGFQGAL